MIQCDRPDARRVLASQSSRPSGISQIWPIRLNGLRMFGLNVRGKAVLLKPNLVEFIAGIEDECKSDARVPSVVVAEGRGHRRDTYLVLAESGLEGHLRGRKRCRSSQAAARFARSRSPRPSPL
jgi:hypothetical protein